MTKAEKLGITEEQYQQLIVGARSAHAALGQFPDDERLHNEVVRIVAGLSPMRPDFNPFKKVNDENKEKETA